MNDPLFDSYMKIAVPGCTDAAWTQAYAQLATAIAAKHIAEELEKQTAVQQEILGALEALLDLKRA